MRPLELSQFDRGVSAAVELDDRAGTCGGGVRGGVCVAKLDFSDRALVIADARVEIRLAAGGGLRAIRVLTMGRTARARSAAR